MVTHRSSTWERTAQIFVTAPRISLRCPVLLWTTCRYPQEPRPKTRVLWRLMLGAALQPQMLLPNSSPRILRNPSSGHLKVCKSSSMRVVRKWANLWLLGTNNVKILSRSLGVLRFTSSQWSIFAPRCGSGTFLSNNCVRLPAVDRSLRHKPPLVVCPKIDC